MIAVLERRSTTRQGPHLRRKAEDDVSGLHEEASGKGEPLVVGDGLVVRVPHSNGYEHIEGNSDKDRSDKTKEEEQDEVVFDEVLVDNAIGNVQSLFFFDCIMTCFYKFGTASWTLLDPGPRTSSSTKHHLSIILSQLSLR